MKKTTELCKGSKLSLWCYLQFCIADVRCLFLLFSAIVEHVIFYGSPFWGLLVRNKKENIHNIATRLF